MNKGKPTLTLDTKFLKKYQKSFGKEMYSKMPISIIIDGDRIDFVTDEVLNKKFLKSIII